MNNVRELLAIKGSDLWSMPPDTSVLDALRVMADKNVGAILITDNGKLIGIFSERDYAREIRLKDRSSDDTAVGDLMTSSVVCVSPDEKINKCMALMTGKRVRHLPVIEDGKLVGVISIGDIVKQVISDQEMTIHELEKYITGGY